MFINYRSQGLIIKKEDLREADELLTIYTRDFGKLEILARAIRKINSKLRSGADIFYLSDIEFIQGKNQKTLTEAVLIDKFKNIRKNLTRLKIAYEISENLDDLIKGQEKDEKVWQLLIETFKRLNVRYLKGPRPFSEKGGVYGAGEIQVTIYKIYYYFLWNLLALLGYQPELYRCSICQKKLVPENLYFDPKGAGIVCFNCSKKIKNGSKILPDTIKILRIFLKRDWQILNRLKIKEEHLNSLQAISKAYLSNVLDQG